jgi:hypothetical protein
LGAGVKKSEKIPVPLVGDVLGKSSKVAVSGGGGKRVDRVYRLVVGSGNHNLIMG